MAAKDDLQQYLRAITEPVDATATYTVLSLPASDLHDVVAGRLDDKQRAAIRSLGNLWAGQRSYAATVRVGATTGTLESFPLDDKADEG